MPRSWWTPADPRRPGLLLWSLCVGFWPVDAMAVCFMLYDEAVSSFRECGLPYGLRDSLCTPQLCRLSNIASFTVATLGTSGWLDPSLRSGQALARPGLAPCKKRQACLARQRLVGAFIAVNRPQSFTWLRWNRRDLILD